MRCDAAGTAAWVLESLGSGVVAVDGEGTLALWNPGARRILGCADDDAAAALGRPCREVLAHQPSVVRLLLDTLAGRPPLSRAEVSLTARDDEAGPTIGFTMIPLRAPDGETAGAAILFRDLRPIERSREQDRLRDRLAALGEMAAGLAHEIRNPLAGMEILAGLLRRRLSDPESRGLVDELIAQVRQLASTVTESLEFVRPAALQREPLDAVGLVEESLTRALARAPRPDHLERRYAPSLPPVSADRELLGSAVANLVINACEAMAAGDGRRPARLRVEVTLREGAIRAPSVRVAAGGERADPTPPGRELEIAVCDDGPGIPEDLRERIFYPFFTTKQRGSGIGLANVQKIAAGHGGSVSLESRPGAGATFRLRLPLDPT